MKGLVGVPGFEPGTSWSQTRRSNLTELHPDAPSVSAGEGGVNRGVRPGAWTGPPNGAITIIGDVLLVLDQSGHSCPP